MTDFGPRHAQVHAFINSLAGLDDDGLWQLEQSVRQPVRSYPLVDTRALAEASGRLLAG